jgi:hypothetical protein
MKRAGSAYPEHVRDAEVEHVLCGRIYHMRGSMVAQEFEDGVHPDLGGRHAGGDHGGDEER